MGDSLRADGSPPGRTGASMRRNSNGRRPHPFPANLRGTRCPAGVAAVVVLLALAAVGPARAQLGVARNRGGVLLEEALGETVLNSRLARKLDAARTALDQGMCRRGSCGCGRSSTRVRMPFGSRPIRRPNAPLANQAGCPTCPRCPMTSRVRALARRGPMKPSPRRCRCCARRIVCWRICPTTGTGRMSCNTGGRRARRWPTRKRWTNSGMFRGGTLTPPPGARRPFAGRNWNGKPATLTRPGRSTSDCSTSPDRAAVWGWCWWCEARSPRG